MTRAPDHESEDDHWTELCDVCEQWYDTSNYFTKTCPTCRRRARVARERAALTKLKETHVNDSTTPTNRRCRRDLMVPAETAITEAMYAVEGMPADVRLTDAVVLLGKARDRVADFVDGKP